MRSTDRERQGNCAARMAIRSSFPRACAWQCVCAARNRRTSVPEWSACGVRDGAGDGVCVCVCVFVRVCASHAMCASLQLPGTCRALLRIMAWQGGGRRRSW